MQNWIGLLDCNNFFVSCERLFRPDLKGKPVLVLSSNDGCVVARSQEIKDRGIPMGVPLFQIKDSLKDSNATIFSSHFALYRDISRRVFNVMRSELQVVEEYSIDEAFFTIEGTPEQVSITIKSIKDKVEQLVGIPVSIGVAASKTQAKYANSRAKKTTGTYVLESSAAEAELARVRLVDIWGVGYRLSDRYAKQGIVTVADFLALADRDQRRLGGVNALRLADELRGQTKTLLNPRHQPQKSIMSSRSFKETSEDIEVIKDAVAYHLREAAASLRAMGLKTNQVRVFLLPSRHGDFLLRGGSKEAVLGVPSNDTFALLKIATSLAEELYEAAVPYKKVGVVFGNLEPATDQQATLFSEPQATKTEALLSVIDSLNQRLGRGRVLLGSRLKTDKWAASAALKSPAYTTSWTDIRSVKA